MVTHDFAAAGVLGALAAELERLAEQDIRRASQHGIGGALFKNANNDSLRLGEVAGVVLDDKLEGVTSQRYRLGWINVHRHDRLGGYDFFVWCEDCHLDSFILEF